MKTLIAAAALSLVALAADAPEPPVNALHNVALGWNHSGLDAEGNPEVMGGFELAMTAATVDLRTEPGAVVLASAKTTEKQIDATSMLHLVKTGTVRFWVRAYDLAGNVSGWADPLPISYDGIAPAAPAGLKVTVTVNVTVTP